LNSRPSSRRIAHIVRQKATLTACRPGPPITLAAAGRQRAPLCPAHPTMGALMTYPERGSAEIIERACASTAAVLAGVRAADFGRPTPCRSWTVKDVINHVIGSAGWYAGLAEEGAVAGRDDANDEARDDEARGDEARGDEARGDEAGRASDDGDEPDRTVGDFQAAFRREADRLIAAFSAPGAMDKIVEMPFGGIPGSVCVWLAAGDIFTHGWDLARATGQPSDLDPELSRQLLAQIERLLPDAMRGPEGEAPFGPKVEVPSSASAADRLAAFQGHQP
jgi:uncharacterized protein (TIGR03086 family)